MRPRFEEEPEPIIVPEPDEDPDEPDADPAAAATATATMVPRVDATAGEREYEYRVDVVTVAQVLDGTLADRLSEASHDEWNLVDIIDAGDQKALLMRKRKQKESSRRPVGFAR
jgi:hypothetical protein